MKQRKLMFRILCTCTAVILTCAGVSLQEDPTEILVLSGDTPSVGVHSRTQSSSVTPYIRKAAYGELDALIDYAAGKDPTAGKSIDEPGQNTKRNTATTLIDIFTQFRPASSFHFQLVPYGRDPQVWEVCAFYTPLFSKTEQTVHTGVIYNYRTQMIYRTDGTGILGIGYDFNFDFDTFYAADDPWQRNFGFCRRYDNMAVLIGDVCETIRVPFRYDGKDWMIQIWKGIYSGNMLGAEIGIYYKPTDRQAEFYDCAADPDRMEMSFAVYLGDEKIVETPHELSWWQTGFTYHTLANPSDLTMYGELTLRNAEMARLFDAALHEQNTAVKIQRDGRHVAFTWAP